MAMEPPECPVCLQSYDGASAIPRVLGCGHSACEACLAKLPERFPLTLRCPACTQLVKFPQQGPSSLPKNIDLLSLSISLLQTPNPNPTHQKSPENAKDFLPRSWSDEFYSSWRAWVLPSDAVSVEERGGLCAVARGKASAELLPGRVSLVRVGFLPDLRYSGFEFSYVYRVMKCLSEMREGMRNELELVLRGSSQRRRKNERVCWSSPTPWGSPARPILRESENCEIGVGSFACVPHSRSRFGGFWKCVRRSILLG